MDGFTALADPTRREIVDMLAGGEKDAGTIASYFPVTKPAISRHLAVLREVGMVTVRSDGQRRIYSIRAEGLHDVDRWLSRYRSFWSDRLDDLEEAMKEKE